ncbi:MAG: PIN domain-containing protein [Akkermansiaceae bacterium]
MKIERGTKVFVDTNVLLEATDEGRRLHALALGLFRNASSDGVELFLGTQVLREYLVVATRPIENNGLGMTTDLALDNIARLQKRVSLVAETLQAGELFIKWAGKYQIHGKRLHDLQILATAAVAGMHALITANDKDYPKSSPLTIIPLSKLNS